MKHDITLFHTMRPDRNALFQTHLLFVSISGLMWSSSVKLLTWDNAGPFESPILPHTLLPPTNEVCKGYVGYVFTGVCLSTGRYLPLVWRVSATCPWADTPRADNHPQADTQPWKHPWANTPLRRHPLGRHPHPLADTTGSDQQAGGTHPTGIHSCLVMISRYILHRQVSLMFYVALGSYCTESNIVTIHL